MKLDTDHIVELVLYRHYSDRYSYASVSLVSDTLDELIAAGMLTILKQSHPNSAEIIISERGRQALEEAGIVLIILALYEVDKPHLLYICNDLITLADMPVLLTCGNEKVRALAKRLYDEWN